MKLPIAQSFQELVVWQKAHLFVLKVYQLTKKFPIDELYGLTSQLRRAGVSIAANIAEGFKKKGRADRARFMNTAQGSIEECRYYLLLGKDLGYITDNDAMELLEEVSKMLNSFRYSILNK